LTGRAAFRRELLLFLRRTIPIIGAGARQRRKVLPPGRSATLAGSSSTPQKYPTTEDSALECRHDHSPIVHQI